MPKPLPDEGPRQLIRTALEENLFVAAGAGSGKTSTLVDRVIALVAQGVTDLERIAAITFTEKAASELRDRVRERLEANSGGPDPAVSERCRRALDQLDRAPIGTLHSFAQRILSEHPVEAGLPPRVEVLDEVRSGIEFDQRWRSFSLSMLADPSMERTLLLLLAGGVDESAARALAVRFEDNWDLVETRVPEDSPDPPDLSEVLAFAFDTADSLDSVKSECRDPEDNLLKRIAEVEAFVERVRSAPGEVEMMEALRRDPPLFKVGTVGRSDSWGGKPRIQPVRRAVTEVGEALQLAQSVVLQACAERLGSAVRRFTLLSAAQRRTAGRLDFHDLLVLARALLSDPAHGADVRRSLAIRYDHLLLDEFQDTDPIQIDIAVRIAAAGAGALLPDQSWAEIPLRPGGLFIVGDPKQSIYRFRRADIATFLEAQRMFEGRVVDLTTNFRTVRPAVDWINRTFSELMSIERTSGAGRADGPSSQPEYQALQAYRTEKPPVGPSVSRIGGSPLAPECSADHVRAAEAEAVARAVQSVVEEGWSVRDGPGGWRRAELGDIAILVPARTSLPFLEDALDERSIPYRAESSSLVYTSRAIRDLLMVLRAVDDPTDELKTVGALRSPLLACGDDDLWRYRVEGDGRWDYTRIPDPDPDSEPVSLGLAYLHALHRERMWTAPSELIDRVVRDRRLMEIAHAAGRERDVWRRVRYVTDQARAWSETTHGTLRQYLRWVDLQAKESARLSEPILPESDHDAVRIMTIHAAKGLEFPVTILSGMSTEPRRRPARVDVVFPPSGQVGYRFGSQVVTTEFEDHIPIDEQMSLDERIRLLYVASTRAQDHLVVSLFAKKRRRPPSSPQYMTNAELIAGSLGEKGLSALPEATRLGPEQWHLPLPELSPAGLAGMTTQPETPTRSGSTTAAPPEPDLMPFEQWRSELTRVRAATHRPGTVAATALTSDGEPDSGLMKRPPDLDLPAWLKGRYGTSVGRAVHGVLQTIDLATGAGRTAAVAAQCQAEGILGREGTVLALVDAALASPAVVEAARAPHWREVFVCIPLAGRLLEGYVDLLYRTPSGLVIVDYKTAFDPRAEELDRRTRGYRLQGASYALAVGRATGEPVKRVVFVYLSEGIALERPLPDLPEAMREVEGRVEARTEEVIG